MLAGWMIAAGLLGTVACGAASTAAPEAGPAMAPSSAVAQAARDTSPDVRFVRGMLAHHAQALEMTALVPARTTRRDLHLLAERIDVSQRDEIALMERWLRARGEEVPATGGGHAHHGGGHAQMPGMLTPDEMARLAAATGAEFERLFLELMIRHHEGALVMVAELFASPGGGQGSEIYQIASDVDADQRAEIARMQRMLAGPPPAPAPR
jgi:uncharacterized protein (DUF305 family)